MAQPNGSDRQTPELTAQEARQGEIVLRSRRRRTIFVAGLAGIVVLVVLGSILG